MIKQCIYFDVKAQKAVTLAFKSERLLPFGHGAPRQWTGEN